MSAPHTSTILCPRMDASRAHYAATTCTPHSTAQCPRWRQGISSRVPPRSASPGPPSRWGPTYLRIASPMGSPLCPPRVPHPVTTSYDLSRLLHTLVARPAGPSPHHGALRVRLGITPLARPSDTSQALTVRRAGVRMFTVAPPLIRRPPLCAQSAGPRRAAQSHTQLCFSSSVYSLRFVLPAIGFGFVGARTRIPDSSSPLFYSPVYACSVPLGYLVRARSLRARASAACRIGGRGNVLYCTSFKK